MAEPVLAWRGLTLDPGDGPPVAIPDLELGPGDSVLAVHPDGRILRALARLAAARDPGEPPEAARPAAGSLDIDGRALGREPRPGERLAALRKVALIDPRARLLSGTRLIDTMILELEYNQGLEAGQALEAALGVLAELGLAELALAPEAGLSGPERALALMALAVSRRPRLLVLDGAPELLGPRGLELAWPLVAGARLGGLAVLALERRPQAWPTGLIERIASLGPPQEGL